MTSHSHDEDDDNRKEFLPPLDFQKPNIIKI
jgi:hypothetical protein